MWYDTLLDFLRPLRSRMPIQKAKRGPARRQPASCKPAFESLEDRCVPAAMLSVSGVAILEGNVGTQQAEVTVTLSEPHSNAVTVNYRTINDTAIAGSDYDTVSGKLTFAKNETSKTILVPIRDDHIVEPDESFFVRLEGAKGGAKIANAQAIVTIVDDEPWIAIDNASAREGTSGLTPMTFTVRLSHQYDLPVSVNWATADGSATAGIDYVADSDTVVFEPGETSKTIEVLVNGDRIPEPDRSLCVNLTSTPDSYAAISSGVGTGSITDSSPRISINNVSLREGTAGATAMTFTVRLSHQYDLPVSVNWATADGAATAGIDYVAKSDTLVFATGETSKTIEVLVKGDRIPEPDRSFYVNLTSTPDSYAGISSGVGTGSILDSSPRISIGDVYHYGETTMTFTVSLSVALDEIVTVDFQTVDATAIAGVDYVANFGTLTFDRNNTVREIMVDVLNPNFANMYFYVQLSNPSGNAALSNELVGGYSYDYAYVDYGGGYGYYDYYYYGYYY